MTAQSGSSALAVFALGLTIGSFVHALTGSILLVSAVVACTFVIDMGRTR